MYPLLPRLGTAKSTTGARQTFLWRMFWSSIDRLLSHPIGHSPLRMIPFWSFARNRRMRYTNQDFYAMLHAEPEYEDVSKAAEAFGLEEFTWPYVNATFRRSRLCCSYTDFSLRGSSS